MVCQTDLVHGDVFLFCQDLVSQFQLQGEVITDLEENWEYAIFVEEGLIDFGGDVE